MSARESDVVLEVRDLETSFHTEEGELRAVAGVSFVLRKGRTLAIVGESGCGKSVTAFSLMRLIRSPGRIRGGKITLHTESRSIDILGLSEGSEALRAIRGRHLGMIFQEALAALSPVHTIGDQLMESLTTHQRATRAEAMEHAVEILQQVGLTQPRVRMGQYPHELSGGMRQRVMIAIALINRPSIVIADEPTTALDVTIQLQVLDLIKKLQQERAISVLLITHDLGVVAHSADDVAVMYLGRIVERGDVGTLLKSPRHPYTQGLLASLPGRTRGALRLPSIEGSVPALSEIPPGCPFHPRCPYALAGTCDADGPPPLLPLATRVAGSAASAPSTHEVACLRVDQTAREGGAP